MKRLKRTPVYVMITIALLLSLSARGQVESTQGVFHFGQGISERTLKEDIDKFIKNYHDWGWNDSIIITGSCSPEGEGKWLAPLARKRALKLRQSFINRGLPAEMITIGTFGIDWPMLQDFAAKDSILPGYDQVNEIFLTGGTDRRLKDALRKVERGRAWRHLFNRYFPQLRYSQATITHNAQRFPGFEPIEPFTLVTEMEPGEMTGPATDNTPPLPPHYWALKSNLIHDVILVPNIGLEAWLGKQWSLYADYSGAWWGYKYRTKLWRYYGGNIELRYWFDKELKPLTGWHLGVYGELASYDFQLGDFGYQGKVAGGGGVIGGYSLPISRHFNMDFSFGVGYFGGKYKKCQYIYGMDYWVSRHNRHWIGPTRAEVSLVWLLGRHNVNYGKGGRR